MFDSIYQLQFAFRIIHPDNRETDLNIIRSIDLIQIYIYGYFLLSIQYLYQYYFQHRQKQCTEELNHRNKIRVGIFWLVQTIHGKLFVEGNSVLHLKYYILNYL